MAFKETANLGADYGEGLASAILASNTNGFHEIRRQMVAHSPLFERHSGMGSVYTILKSVPREEFFAPVQKFKGVFVTLLAVFLLGSLFLSYVATKQFTRPVQKLRQEAEVIAGGDYHSRVDVRTYDEIEDLARQFNIMAQSLEQREEQIARHHEELEQKVRLRTRELENEKDKLQAMQDQLVRSERLAATGEIAAVIAHEMRNSVTSVRMILQLLSENRNIIDTDRDSLDVALDSLGRMERVVKDLLDLGRPTALNRRLEDCNDILRTSIEFARHQMGLGETALEADLDPTLRPVMLDRDRIKEAMVNLILNASQATDGGGTISIRSRRVVLNKELRDLGEVGDSSDETTEIGVQEIVLPKGTEVLQIEVIDTGRGIPEEHLARVFDPFFTTKINGTGLGLSFVKRVVNQHGGIVSASSQVNKGSRFILFIPIGD